MSTIATDLTVHFSKDAYSEPFELVAHEGVGNLPVLLFADNILSRPGRYEVSTENTQVKVEICTKDDLSFDAVKETSHWVENPDNGNPQYNTTVFTQTAMVAAFRRGAKRFRLYCSEAISAKVKLHSGSARLTVLGRRSAEIIEALTWHHSKSSQLKYGYDFNTAGVDTPSIEIIETTPFFDYDGNPMPAPTQVGSSAEFSSQVETTGTIIVKYRPSFTLIEASYSIGVENMDIDHINEIYRSWMAGNIHDSYIPPVRIMAVIPGRVAQTSFEREFLPQGNPTPVQPSKEAFATPPDLERLVPGPMPVLNLGPNYDQAWKRCWKQHVSAYWPDGQMKDRPCEEATTDELRAVQECHLQETKAKKEKQPACSFRYNWVETARWVKDATIYSKTNPGDYMVVEKVVAIQLSPVRTDKCQDEDPNPPQPYIINVDAKDG